MEDRHCVIDGIPLIAGRQLYSHRMFYREAKKHAMLLAGDRTL